MAKKEGFGTSYINDAKSLEDDASIMKSKHLKGAPIKPERIGKQYEQAGDLRRKAQDFIGAEDDYLEANKYGYAYSPTDMQRVKGKINGLISEKRLTLGLHPRDLEGRAFSYLAIISFASALLSISLKLTGSVIGSSSNKSTWISLCLFLLGCMFVFFYFRAKKK